MSRYISTYAKKIEKQNYILISTYVLNMTKIWNDSPICFWNILNQLSIHTWGTILSQAILKKVKKRVPRTLSIKSSGPLFLNFIRKKKIFFANISHFTLLLKLVSHKTSIKGRYDRKSVVGPEKVQNQNSLDFPLKNNWDKLIVTPCSQSVHFIKRLHASTVIDWILWRLITYKIKRIRNLFNFRARVFCLKKKKSLEL